MTNGDYSDQTTQSGIPLPAGMNPSSLYSMYRGSSPVLGTGQNEWSLGLQSVLVRSEVPKAVVVVLVISEVCVRCSCYKYSTASIFRVTEQVQGDAVPS